MEDVISKDAHEIPKEFWSYIKSKKQESSGVAPLKMKDGFIHSQVEILNEQFVSAYTREDSSKIPTKVPSSHPSMEPIEVQSKGVHKVLLNLKIHNAVGPEGIPSFILKSAADQMAPILTKLYQFSLNTGEVPADWKNAFIVLVFKKGEKHIPSNYRPVSLTSAVCKLLEHIVHILVMRHFDCNRILTDHQHGFRAKRSSETQLLTTIHKIARHMAKKG